MYIFAFVLFVEGNDLPTQRGMECVYRHIGGRRTPRIAKVHHGKAIHVAAGQVYPVPYRIRCLCSCRLKQVSVLFFFSLLFSFLVSFSFFFFLLFFFFSFLCFLLLSFLSYLDGLPFVAFLVKAIDSLEDNFHVGEPTSRLEGSIPEGWM